MPYVRYALVTGSASGLGRAIAVRLARDGWRLALADVDERANAETLLLVQSTGGSGECHRLDVSDAAAWQHLRETLQATWPRLDLLVNNAGVACSGEVGQCSLEDWRWAIGVNLWGTIHGCHEMTSWLKANPGGAHVVNIASIAAIAAGPAMAAYNVTKAGVLALSETMFAELRQHNVAVTVVCPGFFPTNLLDRGRFCTSGQRAAADLFTNSTSLSADKVAEKVVGCLRRRPLYLVLPFRAGLLWRFKRFFPRALSKLIAWQYAKYFAQETKRERRG